MEIKRTPYKSEHLPSILEALTKIHKENMPLRFILSAVGSSIYQCLPLTTVLQPQIRPILQRENRGS